LTLGLFLFSVGIGWACASKCLANGCEQRARIIGNWLQAETLVPGITTSSDEARRIAANIAKLPELLKHSVTSPRLAPLVRLFDSNQSNLVWAGGKFG
jgi:hypothetical protein